ncbi:cytochrome P450 [Mycena pura]|uniref:Cytochrome P450 n=1 Tax=Mycena pura TaxID=153505 RepID=A0AAD6YK31_9AGAR|nr:cytochrome P450 [Mycena pura]
MQDIPMSVEFVAACLLALAIISWVARILSPAQKLSNCIPGPKSPSWTYGNLIDLLLTKEYGEHEFKWQETYGPVYSIKACFGESRLMISDPLTAKFILHNHLFAHGASQQKAVNSLFGSGNIFLARGDYHRHLRSILNPSFSSQSVRRMLPMFKDIGAKLVDRWESLGYPGTTVDITQTLHDASLDLISEAIFEHPFNSLTGQSDMASIQRTLIDTVSSVSKFSQLVDACLPYIPDFIFNFSLRLPIPAIRVLQEYRKATNELGRQLIQQTPSRDASSEKDETFIGLLNKTNAAATTMTDEKVGVHIRTILMAGDDTTILYRLAKAPAFQQALREEIQLAGANGGDNIEYDNMPLLNALINETLRLYPALPFAERVAEQDCVLPLSRPITTTTGIQITEMPIQKGQATYVAIASYNRLTSLWGPDAGEFRPSRWLEEQPCKGSAIGPHASLLSFLAGPAVLLEMQVLVTEIVPKFVLTLPPDDSAKPCFGLTLVPRTADGVQQIPIHIEHVA